MPTPPRPDSFPKQLDLEGAMQSRSSQMNLQSGPDDPQAEIQRLQKEAQELAARKEALRQKEEKREQLILRRKDLLYKFKQNLDALAREQAAMQDECNDLEQIRECFERYRKELEYADPESWSKSDEDYQIERTINILNNAERDFGDAVAHCTQRMTRTKMFANKKVGGKLLGNGFKELFAQGLAYHLPLILLGVIALVVYILK